MDRILVIDDDQAVTSVLQRGLAYEGFAVSAANSGREGLELARERAPDVVILDVMMPGMDGHEVLRRLRAGDGRLPVLLLTARDSETDQVHGLDAGADDYVVKPFTFRVVLARVRALLRRRDGERPPVLRFADVSLDTGTREASRGGRAIELTRTEYEILYRFMQNPRRVLTRDLLMDRVWGGEFAGTSNVLETYVKQLRQKLEAGGEARVIHTLRGTGYVLRDAGG